MTEGLHGYAETLADLATDLRDTEHVLDAQTNADVFAYVEVLLQGVGVPPSVCRAVGYSPFNITNIDTRAGADGTNTVAIIRACRKRGGR